jgi:rhamnose transport system permease protein
MTGGRGLLRSLARWEVLLLVVLVGLIAIGTTVSPVFLSGRNFANLVSAVIEVAIMSLPMALIIIAGEIDLSVESMVGLSASILGALYAGGTPIELAIPIVLVVGALGGLLNGILVTRMGLPSLWSSSNRAGSASSRRGSRPSGSGRCPVHRCRGHSSCTSLSP